jgi:predicted Zn-dependent peptidase
MTETILTTLPNGLRLALHPMPATYSATIVVVAGTGSRYEDDASAGISHVLEHMMFKGTARRPSAQLIADTVERLGGRLNASTSREITTYYTKVPSRHVDVGLDLIADMLRGSLLDVDEIEREKGVIVEEIAQGEDVPATVGAHLLQRTIWGDHPLGRPVIGSRETVMAVTRAALVEYLATHYVPARMVLSIAGNVDPDTVTRHATELFGDWPVAAAPMTLPATYPLDVSPVALAGRDGQAHLFVAAPGVALDHPDHMVFALLAEILGGGMSSRLFLEVRERRGLAYSVGAGASTLSDTGTLTVHAGVAPANAADALEVITRELRRLAAEPVSADELERVRGH